MASQSEEPTSANNANFAIALLFSVDNVNVLRLSSASRHQNPYASTQKTNESERRRHQQIACEYGHPC
jgi:hypothetical protein